MDIVLSIALTLTEDGQVGLKADGPGSANKLLMLGLLEFAKGAIAAQAAQPEQPAILPGGFVPRLNGRR